MKLLSTPILLLLLLPPPPARALPARLACDYRLEHKATSMVVTGHASEALEPRFSGFRARIAVPFEPQVLYAAVHTGQNLSEPPLLLLSAWDYAAKMELASITAASQVAQLFTESVTHRAELSCRLE